MNSVTTLEEALALALRLAPKERLQLIERVASSVEHDIEDMPSAADQREAHWGRSLLQMLDEIGPIELNYPEIDDPVEWVRQIRRDEQKRRLGDEDSDA
jgi:hypothetical protein